MKKIKPLMILLVAGILTSCTQEPIQLTKYRKKVQIHTKLQDDFLSDNYDRVTLYAYGQKELSRPEPVELKWETHLKAEDGYSYIVNISESKDMQNPITIKTEELSTSVYNLKIGTKYYWNVTADCEDLDTITSYVESFEIEDYGPRNLYVDGVTNVRDVGGWKIDKNHRVKQGLFYRSGRLNVSGSSTVIKDITEEGEKVLLEDLKIKSEMDLRLIENNEIGSITSSVLGDDINYFSCPMEWQNNNLLLFNQDIIKHIFSDILTQKENYPIIYHCNIGTDRTGLIAFLLNGLLGVKEEDLYYDYLFSNFGLINGLRTSNDIKNYVSTIKLNDGNTLSEKIKNQLLSMGVTNEDISTIKDIFIEQL